MMMQWLEKGIAPFATVAVMSVLVAGCGDEKKSVVYTTRGKDPAYQNDLQDVRARQNAAVGSRARLAKQMGELVARARAALPAGATEEQVKAELRGNPSKYPGWKALEEALPKANEKLEKEMANARALVRARILKEAADKKSVAEGRAVEKKSTDTK